MKKKTKKIMMKVGTKINQRLKIIVLENNEDALPKSAWKPAPPIPSEDRSAGSNKFVYFVCNNVSFIFNEARLTISSAW